VTRGVQENAVALAIAILAALHFAFGCASGGSDLKSEISEPYPYRGPIMVGTNPAPQPTW
jgi:hypothetical protein